MYVVLPSYDDVVLLEGFINFIDAYLRLDYIRN